MRAYERFLKYVTYHTTSNEESGLHPSFAGEFELANALAEEMKQLGIEQVVVDEHCYVYGFIPASAGYETGTPIGFIAHMDTSPEASGRDVHPILHTNYDGAVIKLPKCDRTLDPERFPFLESFRGETVITSDGSTLLGADDKAGVSEILTMAETLLAGDIKHGPIWIAFTPDEEIGEGADFFDRNRFAAHFAYTVDGGDADTFEYENFNAASATVLVKGVSVHPGDAKDVMLNAQNVAMQFHMSLPTDERPEHTCGHEGFFHLTGMRGSVSEAKLHYIVRDHDRARFEQRKQIMKEAAEAINLKYGNETLSLILEDSYYNMKEKIEPHMHLVENALAAISAAGMIPKVVPIRGGTDGARLSFEGLPCPNLGTGGFNYHGEYECITVERMDRVVDILLGIVDRYKVEIK